MSVAMTQYHGLYRGVVVNADDYAFPPHRIQVAIPKLTSGYGTQALPCFPSPKSAGLPSAPQPGEGVWIAFEDGNIGYPVYLGFFGHRDTDTSAP